MKSKRKAKQHTRVPKEGAASTAPTVESTESVAPTMDLAEAPGTAQVNFAFPMDSLPLPTSSPSIESILSGVEPQSPTESSILEPHVTPAATTEPDADNHGHAVLADSDLLDKIDKLFACNVGEYISLPQLVVVGDQSSGKSSVLEGLTKLNFPRDSGLCTRFATRIIFRRNTNYLGREISASIIPGPESGANTEHELRRWRAAGVQTLHKQDFAKMMKQVHDLMGLSITTNDGKPTFSNHVLQLEICGPEEDHVTVIDIPGIFRSTTEGQTIKSDIAVVRNMVLQYMRNPRSVILTVVPSNVDIATQDIIEMAKEVDPLGERTLRILTKPDLVDEGAEISVINLIETQDQSGHLGWIVVRNLGQRQLDNDEADRDAEKMAFFQKAPWNHLRPENWGIQTLKARLQEVLYSNVRRTFPLLRTEIDKRLKAAKKALKLLGIERETPDQQRMLLLEAVAVFEELAHQAVTASYAHEAFDTEEDLRLATLIAARSKLFSEELESWGHQYRFLPATTESDCEAEPRAATHQQTEGSRIDVLSSRKTQDCDDTQNILHDNEEIDSPIREGVLLWVESLYHRTRGLEIGSFNSSLLVSLMKKQSAKWAPLAYGYASDVVTIVHRFICKALEIACGKQAMVKMIIELLMESLLDKYRNAIQMTEFNLAVEGEIPFTLNHYFNDNLTKVHEKRLQASLAKKTVTDYNLGKVVRLSDINLHKNIGNVEHTVQEIHDILQAYYKVARKRFADNVPKHVAIHHLLMSKESPIKLFAASWVSGLSDDKLEDIAGESRMDKKKRRQIRKEIEDL